MTDKQQNLCRLAALLLMATSLSGCNTWSRLTSIGKEPELAPIQNPVDAPGYQAVSMPMPAKPEQYAGANSLWKKGSSGFFQDQRAAKVGDIITVNIEASDNASMKNKTEQYRDDNEDTVNINTLAGYEKYAKDYLPDTVDTSDLFNVMSNHDVQGEGKINRSEKINMTMAAVVTQVLPNDNLVIEGTQEIRVNYELRQPGGYQIRQYHRIEQNCRTACFLRRSGYGFGYAGAEIRPSAAGYSVAVLSYSRLYVRPV